jgi:hypothetical protein
MLPTLRALAVNGDDNDTTWWGIWRTTGAIDVRPLVEGDLRKLETGPRDFVEPARSLAGGLNDS